MKSKRKRILLISIALIALTSITIVILLLINNKQNNYNFTNNESSVIELFDYRQLRYEVDHPIVFLVDNSQEEDRAKRETIEIDSPAELQKGDVVIYDLVITFSDSTYSIMPNTQILWEVSTIDSELANQILTHQIGETFTYEQIINDTKFKKHIGETATIECTVCSIERAAEKTENLEKETDDEYENYTKTNELFDRILYDICANSTFDINREHYKHYYNSEITYYRQLAQSNGVSVGKYAKNALNLSKREMKDLCKEYAIYMVKVNTVAEAIIAKENISFTKEEFDNYSQSQGYSQLDFLIDPSAKQKIENELLLLKLKKFLISNFVLVTSE